MGQVRDQIKSGDVLIKYLHDFDGYNISQFLSTCKQKPKSWHDLNDFVHQVDEKVRVDLSDPKIKDIYNGVDTLINRLCHYVPRKDDLFTGMIPRLTGSISAGVKVGLPHEADYILEIPSGSKRGVNYGSRLEKAVMFLFKKMEAQLFADLPCWIFHSIEKHSRIPGICLILEYRPGGIEEESVGVSVDLVLAHKVNADTSGGPMHKFTNRAQAYLGRDIDYYIRNGDVYRLVNHKAWDVGVIESNILRDLDADKKQAFRVAKYLSLNLVPTNETAFGGTINRELSLKLYGYKPWIKTYRLRQYLLHILLQTLGTDIEKNLTGGLLVLCLLDMVRLQYISQCQSVIDPIMCPRRLPVVPLSFCSRDEKVVELLTHKLEGLRIKGSLYRHLNRYKLLNSECDGLSVELERKLMSGL